MFGTVTLLREFYYLCRASLINKSYGNHGNDAASLHVQPQSSEETRPILLSPFVYAQHVTETRVSNTFGLHWRSAWSSLKNLRCLHSCWIEGSARHIFPMFGWFVFIEEIASVPSIFCVYIGTWQFLVTRATCLEQLKELIWTANAKIHLGCFLSILIKGKDWYKENVTYLCTASCSNSLQTGCQQLNSLSVPIP